MRIFNPLSATLLCAGILWTTGCATTQTRATLTDEELGGAVAAKIHGDAQLSNYGLDVKADGPRNEVTLSGSVPSETLRLRAVDLAKQAYAGVIITDKIDVKPDLERSERSREVDRTAYTEDMARDARQRAEGVGEKIGTGLDDAWIHTKIRTKLVGEGELPFGGINVDVQDKVVTLRGTVDSAKDKAEAERLVKETGGVTTVHNRLVVKKG